MHPEIVRDGPGACPICGMALEPRTVSATEQENPELRDMTRRFWVSAALTVPLFLISMGRMARPELFAIADASLWQWIELILATRDHQDLGSSLCTLGGVGRAHFFQSKHPDPDESRHARDDQDTKNISWPNYHSGSNGDYQPVSPVEPVHELLRGTRSHAGLIEYLPAHPHEGGVGVPEGERDARVVATGVSSVSGRPFNLLVAFERADDGHGNRLGRAVAESSFHHFVDYNWDTAKGCPSFLEEPPGDQIKREPEKLEDVKTYVRNLALWLAPPAD
jgi:hypothetical protein